MQTPTGYECDCFQCINDKTNPYYDREEVPMAHLTCTCASRYVKDAEHESDCDLWLIDEFWAGFLAWDWDREVLVPTDRYPDGHESAYVDSLSSLQYLDDFEDFEDVDEQTLVQRKLAEMDERDRDVALTTDMFIERMLGKMPEDENLTWTKDDDGMWRPSDGGQAVRLPGGVKHYTTGTHTAWDDDGLDGFHWQNYVGGSDRHCETKLTFVNGVTVQATSLSKASERKGDIPDFGLYLDMGWTPKGVAIMLPWRDYGLPNVSYNMARYAIEEAYSWAEAGGIVEVGCIGAHGRTGTVLACMAVLSDAELTPTDAVRFVRTAYCNHAIETREQEWFVAWFHSQIHGTEAPPKPEYKPAPAKVVTSTPKANATQSRSDGQAGDPTKPGRQKRARRSKRGGKRTNRQYANTGGRR